MPLLSFPRLRSLARAAANAAASTLALAALGAGTAPAAAAQESRPLNPTALAGQRVAVLPLTLVAADPALSADSSYAAYRDRRATLAWADSAIGELLEGRGPEVDWVLPPELRKLARRAPGTVSDPDQMGQAALRSTRMRELPDRMRAALRNLVAIAGGRYALVPAALGFAREADGQVRAELSLVLADARNGDLLWRSVAIGTGPTPPAAFDAALATLLPLDTAAP